LHLDSDRDPKEFINPEIKKKTKEKKTVPESNRHSDARPANWFILRMQ
jgi:hypothetical protein